MYRITAMLLAALFVGCSDRPQPTASAADVKEAAPPSAAFVGQLPPALIPIEDVLNRVLEELPQGPANGALREALAALHEALEAENSCAIRTSRRNAEHALRDLSRRQPEEFEADFEVVKLALGSIEEPGKGKC